MSWQATAQPGIGLLHGNDANPSQHLDTTGVSVPWGLWEEGTVDLGQMGCSGASLCTAPAFHLPCSRLEGWLVRGQQEAFPTQGLVHGLVPSPGDVEGSGPPGDEGEGR